MADNDEKTRDPRSNQIDPKTGQSRSKIKEDAGDGSVIKTGEGATSDAKTATASSITGGSGGSTTTTANGGSGTVTNSAMQTDNLPTKSLEEVTFAEGSELISPTGMADDGRPATEDDAGTGKPTTLADGREQTGETTSTGLPTAMADEAPSGGQSSGAKKVSAVMYSRREIEEQGDPDHLPRGIKEHQSSGARKTYAGISGMADKHQNKER